MPATPISRPEDTSPKDRLAALEQDLANLRKGMVQQLTASGRLLKTIFTIDQEYFGGRFTGQRAANEITPDPLRDLALATQISEAIADELQGSSAFADSPLLRDAIANLLQTFETVRDESLILEQAAIDVLALPIKPEPLKNHTFPDDNPLACLAESAAVVHELVAVLRRVKDRISGVRLMLNEAEQARHEAENAVTPVDLDAIAGAVTDELHRTQADLADLARHNEEQEHILADLQAALHAAQAETAEANELRAATHAELRGLAAEIARQAAQRPGAATQPSPELGALCRVLADDDSAERLGRAAEAVVMELLSATPVAAASPATVPSDLAERLAQAERALAERDHTCAALRSECDRAHSELEHERLEAAQAAAHTAAVQARLEQLQAQSGATTAATHEQHQALQAELDTLRAAAQRSDAARAALQAEAERTTAELDKERRYAARASADLAALREQLAAFQNQASQRDAAIQQAQTRQQEQEHQARQALEHVTHELSGMRRKIDEDGRTLRERERALTGLRDTVSNLDQAREAAVAAHQRAEEALTAAKAALAARTTTLELTQRQLAESEAALTTLRQDHAAITAERDRLAQAVDAGADAQAKNRQALEQQLAELARQLADLTAQHQALTSRSVADSEALTTLHQDLATAQATVRETSATLAEVRAQLASAQATVRSHETELDSLRRRCAEAEATLRRSIAEYDERLRRAQADLAAARREAVDACDARDAAAAAVLQARRDNEKLSRELAQLTATLNTTASASAETNANANASVAASANDGLTSAAPADLEQRLAAATATADTLRADIERLQRQVAAAAQAHQRTSDDLTYTLAREHSLAQERVELLAERKRLSTALDVAKAELVQARTAGSDDQRNLQARLTAQDEATRTLSAERERLARELADIRPRLEQHDRTVGALTDERDRFAAQVTKLTQERDQLDRRLGELDATCLTLRQEQETALARQRSAEAELERLRAAEQETKRISDDAIAKAARLTGDVAVLRERLSAQARSHDQAIARASDAVAAAERAAEERATATTALTQVSGERDRLKQALANEHSERVQLQQRFDENQSQSATKLSDAQRLLQEARTVHQRLSDEAERLRTDVARLDALVTQQQRERTATQTTNARIAELERQLAAEHAATAALRAEMAKKPTRNDAPAENPAELAALRTALATAQQQQAKAEQARRDTRSRCEELVRAARDAVMAAKQHQERSDAEQQTLIAELNRKIQELQLRTAPQL